MQRKSLNGPSVVSSTAATIDGAVAACKWSKAEQNELICDLGHILARLDAVGLSLAAIHVETAIRAIKSDRR